MKTLIAMTSAAALIACATGACAQSQSSDVPTAKVSYADLDIAHAKGRAVLEQRVGYAVDRVCGPAPAPTELTRQASYRACKRVAWNGAKQQLAQIYGNRLLADASVKVSAGR